MALFSTGRQSLKLAPLLSGRVSTLTRWCRSIPLTARLS